MRLVIDTGILISALLKDSVTREILLFSSVDFLLPEYAFEEIEKHKDNISTRSGLSRKDVEIVLSLVTENITIIPASKLKPYMENAHKLIGSIDPFDVPFIALALSTENDGIWSNDKHFKNLKGLKVWKTSDVFNYLKNQL
ncbi:MAG: PIN domain-containing protein [Thermodesulfovibrionales bacterium]|nr:PIN domain-containing protein [Thermodesulfovibrionales bacterium]